MSREDCHAPHDVPGEYQTCMCLEVDPGGDSVTLMLDTGRASYYAQWIGGEGSDICEYRDSETHKVIGVRLPLYNKRLVVHYDGPIRINAGFRKDDPA